MISIGLADDQQLVRSGIATLIDLSGIARVCWQAANGLEAQKKLISEPVDMLISDIRMPQQDGIALVTALRAQGSLIPVLMLTTFDDHELFLQALTAGANGFLLKDIDMPTLVDAIQKIAAGGFVAEPVLVSQISMPLDRERDFVADCLSEKEQQILKLVAAGLSNKEIAGAVYLAEGTVKNHLSAILAKLHCRDRTQAVLRALHWQLI
ncbi:response regulator transcription factor [Alkalimonas collagenimarina]|uniref:Response regulator transcription factor n=1 Tax=Alkalimonas collagenimarina TaxID=400390 RepID=A0ABT9GYJ4_9GAMM|nr:response regulator transcription factor [Alkalimonas collagenimarina]MDP4535944.1 response regulator transcription factor [Alkalimonas collagenimarina]